LSPHSDDAKQVPFRGNPLKTENVGIAQFVGSKKKVIERLFMFIQIIYNTYASVSTELSHPAFSNFTILKREKTKIKKIYELFSLEAPPPELLL